MANQPLPVPPIPLEPAPIEAMTAERALEAPAPMPSAPMPSAPMPSAPMPSAPTEAAAPAEPDSTPVSRLITPPVAMPVNGPRVSAHQPNGHQPNAHPHGPNGHGGPPRPPMRPAGEANGSGNGADHHDDEPSERGATGPQLRRFIKSRAYVPMHELRRRFLINGGDDEVTPVDMGERRTVYVGLPEREGRLLGELLRGGDIGYELSLDPISPIVVGVYPMRPVTRA